MCMKFDNIGRFIPIDNYGMYLDSSEIICVERVKGNHNSCITLKNGVRINSKSFPLTILKRINKARKETTK